MGVDIFHQSSDILLALQESLLERAARFPAEGEASAVNGTSIDPPETQGVVSQGLVDGRETPSLCKSRLVSTSPFNPTMS